MKHRSKPRFKNPFYAGDWLLPAWQSGLMADLCENRLAPILTVIAAHLPQPWPADAKIARLVGMGRGSPKSARKGITAPLAFLEAAGFIRVAERFGRQQKCYQLVDARWFGVRGRGDERSAFLARRIADLNWHLGQDHIRSSAFKSDAVGHCRDFLRDNPLPADHWQPCPENADQGELFPEDQIRDAPMANVRAGASECPRQEDRLSALALSNVRAGADECPRPGADTTVLTVIEQNEPKENRAKRGSAAPSFSEEGVKRTPSPEEAAKLDADFDQLVDVFPPERRNKLVNARREYHRLRGEGKLTPKTAEGQIKKIIAAESGKKSPFVPYLMSFLDNGMYRPQQVANGPAETPQERAMREYAHTPEPMRTSDMVIAFGEAYYRQHGKSLGVLLTADDKLRLSSFLGRSSFATDDAAYQTAIAAIPKDATCFIDEHHDRLPKEGLGVVKGTEDFGGFIMDMVARVAQAAGEDDDVDDDD